MSAIDDRHIVQELARGSINISLPQFAYDTFIYVDVSNADTAVVSTP
jgi:hypothetical protein